MIQKVGRNLFLESSDLSFPVTDHGQHRRDQSSYCTVENPRCRFRALRGLDRASCERRVFDFYLCKLTIGVGEKDMGDFPAMPFGEGDGERVFG